MTAMKNLIKKLEAASEGSPWLDSEIIDAIFDDPRNAAPTQANERGFDPSATCYTTKLDAALPGERVTSTLLRANGKWYAQALDEQNVFHTGEANTEALARRIAALKARGAQS